MPFSAQVCVSVSLMGRDASETSVVPSQKSEKPSPVPGPSTTKPKSGLAALKSSETACETGWTVDEPETKISPETVAPLGAAVGPVIGPVVGPVVMPGVGDVPPPPHATTTTASIMPARPLRIRSCIKRWFLLALPERADGAPIRRTDARTWTRLDRLDERPVCPRL